MSDSSWQGSVLRELGVAERGLVTFDAAPVRPVDGASEAEHRAAALPETAANPAPVARPQPADVHPPTAPQPQPNVAAPVQPQPAPVAPLPEPPVAPVLPEPPTPVVSQPAPVPQPPVAPSLAEPPMASPLPEPAQPVEEAVPLVNDEFDWAAAVSPVGGGAPQAPGMAQAPGVEEEEVEPQQAASPPAPVAPAPTPQQGAAVPGADEFVRKNQHGDALIRRVGLGVRRAVGGSGSVKGQADIAAYLQRPVSSYRQIAVVSVRGGAGKTTMAALLATALARHRADRVLAMDADADLGSLPLRLGVRSELSLFDLAGKQPRTFEEAAQYLSRTSEGLWVLSATRGGRIAGEFTLETFQSAFSAVNRYFSTAVMDCSAGILTELHRGILAHTHGVVLVTPGTVDGALSARGALEWFASGAQRELLSRTVIAMVTHAPQVGADLERATQMLSAWGTPVVHVPYDRHVSSGAALDMARLGEATQAAALRLAYEAFRRALGDLGEPAYPQ